MPNIKSFKIEDNHVYYLFKRGKHEHIKALYESGEIFMSTIDFIRTCDDNLARTDKYDAISKRTFSNNSILTIAERQEDLDNGNGLELKTSRLVKNEFINTHGNIYCLTGIYTEDLLRNQTELNFDTTTFGEDVIFIYKPKIFLERLVNELKENGFDPIYNKVKYYSDDFSGDVGVFGKHENFANQNEFRIYIRNPKNENVKINIGKLHDIAIMEKTVNFSLQDSKGRILKIKL